jgi:hypothetical protein
MDNKDVKRRDVMGFDNFSKAYEQAGKVIPLKKGENAHPGAHAIQGENLYVRNDANPYKAMGIPHDEAQSDINPKYMNANQVDVFHGRKLTTEEKKTVTDAYGSQVVTHHQMAFILDESVSEEIKWGMINESEKTRILGIDDFNKSIVESEDTENIKAEIAKLEAENAEGYKEDIQKLKLQLAVKGLQAKTKVSEAEETEEAEEEEVSPAEAAKAEYDGKSVTLNGDHAKLTDKDGTANIKSETNELSMSWVEAGEKMKKGGNFRTEKKEEPKEEKPKEEKKEKKEKKD